MASTPPRIVAIGEVLWDLLPAGPQLGGAPSNFACHARDVGGAVELVSAVGDDALGREILRRMEARGVGTAHVAVLPDRPTGTVDVALDAAGKPTYTIVEGVAWDFVPWSDALGALAASADVVCWGSLCQRAPVSRETILRLVDAAGPGTLRLCDINLREAELDAERIAGSLRRADVLKCNDEELPRLAALFGIEASVDALAEHFGLKGIALTRGAHGSLLRFGDRVSDHPGIVPERVVDTVGAGDAFTAVLAAGLLRGDDLDAINERANRRAAAVCAHPGATPELGPEI